jgi:hypothetical protein
MRTADLKLRIWTVIALLFAGSVVLALAQETPAPAQSASATPVGTPVLEVTSPNPSVSPAPSVSPTITPSSEPSPSASVRPPTARSVRISFLPPPLEGTISVGIYDESNKLVRVLHQESELDEFAVGDDALSTKWDGRDDDGFEVAPGRYQARGFIVGKIKNEPQSTAQASPSPANVRPVKIKLMENPLGKDGPASVELLVGFDDENSYLKTVDGLPLYTISAKSNVQRAGITKTGERSAEVWQDEGAAVERFRLSNLDRMMAFDCGDFEVK